jgi:hypothetical protein
MKRRVLLSCIFAGDMVILSLAAALLFLLAISPMRIEFARTLETAANLQENKQYV